MMNILIIGYVGDLVFFTTFLAEVSLSVEGESVKLATVLTTESHGRQTLKHLVCMKVSPGVTTTEVQNLQRPC